MSVNGYICKYFVIFDGVRVADIFLKNFMLSRIFLVFFDGSLKILMHCDYQCQIEADIGKKFKI